MVLGSSVVSFSGRARPVRVKFTPARLQSVGDESASAVATELQKQHPQFEDALRGITCR